MNPSFLPDSNSLSSLPLLAASGSTPLPLRILRVSNNRLTSLDVTSLTHLRTLYADYNSLAQVHGLGRRGTVENISLRGQRLRPASFTASNGRTEKKAEFDLNSRDVRDAKRLYLSGNPLAHSFVFAPNPPPTHMYDLLYLELASCRLTSLPLTFSSLVPNLRSLNLNYNFFSSSSAPGAEGKGEKGLITALSGLTRLRRLSVIGSGVREIKTVLGAVKGMKEVEELDFRMNPCTLSWYLPLLVPQEKEKPASASDDSADVTKKEWAARDISFRRSLPDSLYIGRLAYRGLVMRNCGRVRVLDGVDVSEKERVKAAKVVDGMKGRREP